jgi:hypothetical protein
MTKYSKRFGTLTRKALLCGMAWFAAATAWADPPRVVSVEEHWELQIAQPDADSSAPQITMVMSPSGELAGSYFLFTLNHAAVPDYRSGGMQVQHWDGEALVDNHVSHENDELSNNDEVVTWVQRLSLEDGTLTFEVSAGDSETWGSFGGNDLTLTTPSSLTGLNAYRPAISLTESEVGFAENRVTSLTLKKLVWVTDDGEVHEQNAPIPIDTSLDP